MTGGVACDFAARTKAVRTTIHEMAQKGIPAFVDRSGREWSPEAYVNMDIRATVKNTALRYKNAGRSLVGDGSAHDYFVHEMGHHIQWEAFDAKTNNAVGSRMSQYAGRISGYATASKSEYFAESFAAFEKGELDKLDPDFVSFLRGKTLDKSAGSGIIEIERAMAAKTFDKAAEYAKKELGTSISSLSELPLKTVNAVNNSIGKLYKDFPSLSGIIDEVVVDDIDEIAKSALGWVNGSPRIRLKLSRAYFANMTVDELEEAVSNLANAGVFTPKTGFYGIFQHEAVHLAEFQQTIKRYGGYEEAIKQSLDRFELAKEIKELALRNCSLDDTSITANSMLCSYAEYNAAEYLAEGYSSTNSNPLTDEIKRLLHKKWGM